MKSYYLLIKTYTCVHIFIIIKNNKIIIIIIITNINNFYNLIINSLFIYFVYAFLFNLKK